MKILEELFEGRKIVIIEENGILLFEVESVAMAIGYITIAKGKEYPHKSRIKTTLKNADISTVVHGVQQFMNESQLYDFLIEAHTAKSKAFKKWLSNEVLPTIERTGAYIEDGREEEMIERYFPSISDDVKLLMIKDLPKAVKK